MSLDRFCQRNKVVKHAKLYRCVVKIKMKAEFEDGCGLSKGVRNRGVGSTFPPWSTFVLSCRLHHKMVSSVPFREQLSQPVASLCVSLG